MNHNYQKELESILQQEKTRGQRLLLHSCCAPCSSYVLSYLQHDFRITVFYFNPNITQAEEYERRAAEQARLIGIMNEARKEEQTRGKGRETFPIGIRQGEYRPEAFLGAVRGLEQCPEGGERCRHCFSLRLEETARLAREQGFDYFTTTLTISPLKNAPLLNEIGQAMGERYGIAFLPSDFKKKDGFKKSIELSRRYDLYRQDYCGCVFSRTEREKVM